MVTECKPEGKQETPELERILGCGCEGKCNPCKCSPVKDKASAVEDYKLNEKVELALGAVDEDYSTKTPSKAEPATEAYR